jgi:hypothetical protein
MSSRRAGDEGVGGMNRSTAPELGLRAICSHRRLGRGLEEAEAVEEIGRGLSFVSPDPSLDVTVEAVEDDETRRFVVGVLRHADEPEDAALFEALVDETRRYREVRPT